MTLTTIEEKMAWTLGGIAAFHEVEKLINFYKKEYEASEPAIQVLDSLWNRIKNDDFIKSDT